MGRSAAIIFLFLAWVCLAKQQPPELLFASRASNGDVVTSGLLAFWKLDESSGTTASDSSGNGKTGSLVNAPTWGPANFGNGLTFASASSQKVTCGDLGLSSLTAASLSCWFKRTSAGAAISANTEDTGTKWFGMLAHSDGKVYALAASGSGSDGNFASNDTSWHHLVVIYDGSLSGNANRLKAYLDNVAQTLTFLGTIPASLPAGMASWELGHDTVNSEFSSGSIDSVRVYNRALTAGEVATLFTNP